MIRFFDMFCHQGTNHSDKVVGSGPYITVFLGLSFSTMYFVQAIQASIIKSQTLRSRMYQYDELVSLAIFACFVQKYQMN